MRSIGRKLFLIFLGIGSWTLAIAGDESKAAAEQAVQRMAFYREEASKLSASELYRELERQRNILSIKMQSRNQAFFMNEDTYKATGYAAALEEKRKASEPSAAYFFGLYNWRICSAMHSADKGQLGSTVKDCWLESLESFKVASNANISAASFNIARQYESGFGVLPSKLVAAEWYVKAANQYLAEKSRDEALSSIEAALNLVPDHPAAKRLKGEMLR